jgi:hypothetical protein
MLKRFFRIMNTEQGLMTYEDSIFFRRFRHSGEFVRHSKFLVRYSIFNFLKFYASLPSAATLILPLFAAAASAA